MPTLRSKTEYVNLEQQLGRQGRVAGNLEGVKQRKRKRKSERNKSPLSLHESSIHVATAPPMVEEPTSRMTRSKPIRCLDFGPHRQALYPLHKMCSHCNNGETRRQPGMGRKSSGNSQRNKCQAGHTSHIFPTTL